jgi:hypothetical protein
VATFFRWLDQSEPLRRQYAIAKEIQGHMIFEEGVEIVDEAKGGTMEEIQAAKLRSDARWRWAGKLLPKVYGDKMLHTGGDGEGPIGVKLSLDYSLLTPQQLVQLRDLITAATPRAEAPLMIEGEAEGGDDDDA